MAAVALLRGHERALDDAAGHGDWGVDLLRTHRNAVFGIGRPVAPVLNLVGQR